MRAQPVHHVHPRRVPPRPPGRSCPGRRWRQPAGGVGGGGGWGGRRRRGGGVGVGRRRRRAVGGRRRRGRRDRLRRGGGRGRRGRRGRRRRRERSAAPAAAAVWIVVAGRARVEPVEAADGRGRRGAGPRAGRAGEGAREGRPGDRVVRQREVEPESPSRSITARMKSAQIGPGRCRRPPAMPWTLYSAPRAVLFGIAHPDRRRVLRACSPRTRRSSSRRWCRSCRPRARRSGRGCRCRPGRWPAGSGVTS